MVENERRFGSLAVLNRSPHKRFHMSIMHEKKNASERTRTRTMKAVGVMERSYDTVLSQQTKNDGKLARRDVNLAKIERYRPLVVRDGITITTNEKARVAEVHVRRSSTASFVTGSVKPSNLSIIKTFFVLGSDIAAVWGSIVLRYGAGNNVWEICITDSGIYSNYTEG